MSATASLSNARVVDPSNNINNIVRLFFEYDFTVITTLSSSSSFHFFYMLSTPTKPASRRGPVVKELNVNDFCRFCGTNLRITRCSTENLFKPSERKDTKGDILAEKCKKLGFTIEKSEEYSERICNACARKIRNAAEIVSWLNDKLVLEKSKRQDHRQKRSLSTTITPDRKSNLKARRGGNISKNLFDTQHDSEECGEFPNVNNGVDEEDYIKHLMNIDTIDVESKSKVRILVAFPDGHVTVRDEFDEVTTTMLRGIVRKNWRTVANAIFNHDGIREEIPVCIQ